MSESTRKKIVYLALVAAIVWGGYNLYGPHRKPVAQGTPTIQPVSAAIANAAATAPAGIEQRASAAWGRDPFRTIRYTGPRQSRSVRWVVTGIVYNDTSPLAYVNRKAVRKGDTIDDATVVNIDRKSVTLEYQGDRIEITISKG